MKHVPLMLFLIKINKNNSDMAASYNKHGDSCYNDNLVYLFGIYKSDTPTILFNLF